MTNLIIRCFEFTEGEEPGSVGFWKINGSVYGPLHVPKEYIVCADSDSCDLNYLIIPIILSEMDGYIFQCVSIDYHNNTVHLRRRTELIVVAEVQNGE